jgi:L-lactate dehydrogenase complex protein LldG
MNPTREQMLQRIREAVIEGNRAGGSSPTIPERGPVGYQGAGADPVARFREAFSAAGGHLHVVADGAAAVEVVLDLMRSRSIRRVLLGHGDVLDALRIIEPLQATGVEVVDVCSARSASTEWFPAELGLSGVDYLIAETGSVVLASRPEQPRSLSLLPPFHVAVAERRQILPDLFDLFTAAGARGEDLPACLSVITGPSKTGDIELRLVTGVHGPGDIHVVLIDSSAGDAVK